MKRYLSFLLVILIALALFTGCAKSEAAMDNWAEAPMADAPAADAAPMEPEAEYWADESVSDSAGGFDITDSQQKPVQDRKIIYTAEYSISTENYEQDYELILSAMNDAGGYLSAENTYGTEPVEYYDSGRHSDLTLRIPVENYNTFLNALEGIGTVDNKTQSTEDVTSEYYDNEARIEFYEAHYEKLMDYLDKAVAMEDILSIEAQIRDTLYTLDSLKGTRSYYDKMTQYTTVHVYLDEYVASTAVVVSKSPLGKRLSEGIVKTFKGMGVFFEEFLIVLVIILPWLILVGGLFCAVFFPLRRRRKKKLAAIKAAIKEGNDN